MLGLSTALHHVCTAAAAVAAGCALVRWCSLRASGPAFGRVQPDPVHTTARFGAEDTAGKRGEFDSRAREHRHCGATDTPHQCRRIVASLVCHHKRRPRSANARGRVGPVRDRVALSNNVGSRLRRRHELVAAAANNGVAAGASSTSGCTGPDSVGTRALPTSQPAHPRIKRTARHCGRDTRRSRHRCPHWANISTTDSRRNAGCDTGAPHLLLPIEQQVHVQGNTQCVYRPLQEDEDSRHCGQRPGA